MCWTRLRKCSSIVNKTLQICKDRLCETYTDLDACLRSRAGRLDGSLGSRWAQRTLRAARMDGNGRFARRSPSSPSGFVRLAAATLPRGTPLLFRRRCSSRDGRDFLFISRASQIDGEKRSDFNIGASGNFYRKSGDGRSLTLSSRPPSFVSTLSLQPFRSLTTRPIPRPPFSFLLAVVQ